MLYIDIVNPQCIPNALTSVSFMDSHRPIEHRVHSSQVQKIVSVEEGISAIWGGCGYREEDQGGTLITTGKNSRHVYPSILYSPQAIGSKCTTVTEHVSLVPG